MTRSGADFETFHKLCDNIAPNLLLIKDDKDKIFVDSESFLFSFNKNKKYCPKHKEDKHIFCYSKCGPWFNGGDIRFNSTDMNLSLSFGDGVYLNESLSSTNTGSFFKVQEMEFFIIEIMQ